jgi:hypothetical protein
MKINKQAFTYLVIILVMINNIEHLAYVHFGLARHWFRYEWMNQLHSIIVVVIIELSIIELVRRGKIGFAGFYTLCLFVLSLIYYPLSEYVNRAAWGSLIAAIVFSIMFTISIWYFSVLAAEKKEEEDELESYKNSYLKASRSLTELERKLVLYDSLKSEVEELRRFKAITQASCICPNCNREFPTENAKRGHMANCKK